MKISVTAEHIANASSSIYASPVALAVGDGAIANHVAVYLKGDRYELPLIAIENEKAFDYYQKCQRNKEQGTYLNPLQPYEFELLKCN